MARFTGLLLALVLVACSNSETPDARTNPPDAPGLVPDAPGAATDAGANPDAGTTATFADFVKDLIVNQTADNTPPVAVDFASPDDMGPGAFNSLFP